MTVTMASTLRFFLLCALALLAGCAPLAPEQTRYPVGRGQLVLPGGLWQDLGVVDEDIALLPQPGGHWPLQTRTVVLRGAQQEPLAVLRVQTNRTPYGWAPNVLWPQGCPAQRGVLVEDATRGDPTRVDCLRFKLWPERGQWLAQDQPALAQWLHSQQLAIATPHSYLGYRYTTAAGATVAVDVLVDQRLLLPRSSGSVTFLLAGRPALDWGRELARAARVSVGLVNGVLTLPPSPYALP